MLNRSSFASCVAALLVVWMAPAGAQLNAVFVGNVSLVCVSSTAGFDANLALLGPGFIGSSTSAGTLTFNPDGTGMLNNKTLNIGHAATGTGATPASQSQITCPFTYTYDSASGMIDASFGTCPGVTLTGPGVGQQTEVTGMAALYLLVEQGTTLVGVRTKPTVETFRNLTTGFTNQRICHRTGTRFLRSSGRGS